MGDHDYTSEDPVKNVCKEENSCIEAPEENVVIENPLVISGKPNQVSGKDLKSEIIKEFNQFLTEEEKLEELNELLSLNYEEKDPRVHYSLGRSFIFAIKTVSIDVVETNQYDIHMGDEITVEDKRRVRFKYDHTATRDNRIRIKVFCEGDSSYLLVFRLKDKKKILEKNVSAKVEYSCVLDKTTQSGIYIISIWAVNKISASIKVLKEDVIDTLYDERGAIWINKNDVDFIKNNRFIKLRWYLPKELVGVLLGILERKVRGESDGLIRQAYDSGVMPFVGVMLSCISLFTSGIANIILFFGGTMITFGEPKEYYKKLYWEVGEITGRYREGAVEKFKNGCVIEIYDEYKPAPQMQYNPGVTDTILKNIVKVSVWDNPQEQMRGELGYRGKFISNNSPDAEEEFSSFSLER